MLHLLFVNDMDMVLAEAVEFVCSSSACLATANHLPDMMTVRVTSKTG